MKAETRPSEPPKPPCLEVGIEGFGGSFESENVQRGVVRTFHVRSGIRRPYSESAFHATLGTQAAFGYEVPEARWLDGGTERNLPLATFGFALPQFPAAA